MTENTKTKVNKWKTIAIIFIILFTLETSLIIWGITLINEEEENINECYYNICNGYPDAYLFENVCYCYDYDDKDELVVVETNYMN